MLGSGEAVGFCRGEGYLPPLPLNLQHAVGALAGLAEMEGGPEGRSGWFGGEGAGGWVGGGGAGFSGAVGRRSEGRRWWCGGEGDGWWGAGVLVREIVLIHVGLDGHKALVVHHHICCLWCCTSNLMREMDSSSTAEGRKRRKERRRNEGQRSCLNTSCCQLRVPTYCGV